MARLIFAPERSCADWARDRAARAGRRGGWRDRAHHPAERGLELAVAPCSRERDRLRTGPIQGREEGRRSDEEGGRADDPGHHEPERHQHDLREHDDRHERYKLPTRHESLQHDRQVTLAEPGVDPAAGS